MLSSSLIVRSAWVTSARGSVFSLKVWSVRVLLPVATACVSRRYLIITWASWMRISGGGDMSGLFMSSRLVSPVSVANSPFGKPLCLMRFRWIERTVREVIAWMWFERRSRRLSSRIRVRRNSSPYRYLGISEMRLSVRSISRRSGAPWQTIGKLSIPNDLTMTESPGMSQSVRRNRMTIEMSQSPNGGRTIVLEISDGGERIGLRSSLRTCKAVRFATCGGIATIWLSSRDSWARLVSRPMEEGSAVSTFWCSHSS
mmetsp:Transcript_23758/g.54640  ORF Transcript_23758/g.54640 Transcript_23758/m.54640 type:complete len:257 (+) Transcript_23758:150-920(+)